MMETLNTHTCSTLSSTTGYIATACIFHFFICIIIVYGADNCRALNFYDYMLVRLFARSDVEKIEKISSLPSEFTAALDNLAAIRNSQDMKINYHKSPDKQNTCKLRRPKTKQ